MELPMHNQETKSTRILQKNIRKTKTSVSKKLMWRGN